MKHQYFILFITVFLSSSTFAQLFSSGLNGGDKKYSTEVINPYDTVKAGDTIQLATKVSLKDNWKGYYLNPGENGVGSKIEWDSDTLLELEGLTFPTPKSKQSGDGYDFYYLNEYVIISNLKVSPDAKPGTYTVTHTDKITVCEIGGQCIPGRGVDTPLSITIGNETKTNSKKSLIDSALKIAVNKNTAVEANASAEGFELSIEFDSNLDLSSSKDLVLIPDNKYNTAKSPFVTLEQTDTGYSFKYLLPSDHEVEENFSAILTTKDAKLTGSTTSLYLETKLTGKVTEGKEAKVAWTSAEKEEHAAFYDPDSKILTDAAEADEGQNIFTILFFAFIGGMILNLMPCVFPVLGLKVMGFAQMSGNDPKKIKIHGIVFTLGVLVSMWVLAGALLALSVTTKINWGEQMGNPIFVGCIIILLFVMGLNMYGIFEIGTKLTSAGGNLQNKKGYSGSFFSGILTTLIATPCSGPFLGATMSYALTQPAVTSLAIFSVFAFGISFPYIALAFLPALINKLPKPGAWMEVFKKFMAFPLFATAVFFLKAFGGQTGTNGMYWLSMSLVLFGMAAWAYGTWSNPYIAKMKRFVWGFGLPILVLGSAVWMSASAMSKKAPPQLVEGWQQWHPGLVEHHIQKKRVVWVDYTAEW